MYTNISGDSIETINAHFIECALDYSSAFFIQTPESTNLVYLKFETTKTIIVTVSSNITFKRSLNSFAIRFLLPSGTLGFLPSPNFII